jgi:hypothetical protein
MLVPLIAQNLQGHISVEIVTFNKLARVHISWDNLNYRMAFALLNES